MKNKRLYILFISLAMISGSFLFYWFQIRPSKIKHDCSWVKKHSNAVPAKQGMTEEQLKEKGMIKTCPILDKLSNLFCEANNATIMEEKGPRKFIPAKDWWVKATKEEYQFCLHNNGL